MTLLADLPKLREMERKASATGAYTRLDGGQEQKKKSDDLIAAIRNAAPAMIEVLECFREGDALRLLTAAGNMEYSHPGPFTDKEIDCIKRLQKAAALMEGKGDE